MPGRGSEILARQFTHVEFSGNLDSGVIANDTPHTGFNIISERECVLLLHLLDKISSIIFLY